jgi:hypothetical protein
MNGRAVCQRYEVGDRQRTILMRANLDLVMTLDGPERKAAMRLVRRGILTRQRFGSPSIGWITIYRINP